MQQRVITAIFFVAAMLAGVFVSKETFIALFALVAAGSAWEYSGLVFEAAERGMLLRRVVTTVLSAAVYGFGAVHQLYNGGPLETNWAYPAIGFGVLALGELFGGSHRPFDNLGRYLVALLYIVLPLVLLCDIAMLPAGVPGAQAYFPWRVMGLLLLIWTNDTMAYFVGSKLGKTKLFERISPKKTWEGSIGGALFTLAIALGLSYVLPEFNRTQWLALGATAAVFGTLGDLVESMLKRSLAIKDSGSLLPGHGGLLDRFDAFFFYLPFAWLILKYLSLDLV